MKKSHDIYPIIANEAMMGFIVFDMDSRECLYANPVAKLQLEISPETSHTEISIKKLFPKIPKDIHFKALTEKLLAMEGLFQDVLIRKANGNNFISNLGIKYASLEEHQLLILMIQDVSLQYKLKREIISKQTEINSAYSKLMEQNESLKHLDVAKDKFIALTTHELRTPLSAVIASSEILKLKLYDNEEQLEEFIDIIYDQGKILLELVNDILDFSKIQAGKMDLFIGKYDLVESVTSQIQALDSMAQKGKIDIKFETPETQCRCYFDHLRMSQVINNILSNAIKYNKESGSVKIWIKEDSNFFHMYVKDTGEGIHKEQFAKVFDEFETIGKIAQHSNGTGLGMPITQRLIAQMGGAIHLKSKVGAGSTFWIDVPKNKILDEALYRSRPTHEDDLAA